MTTDLNTTPSPSALRASTIESAREAAQKALLCAASRVLSYHAARLDAKVGRADEQPFDRPAATRDASRNH